MCPWRDSNPQPFRWGDQRDMTAESAIFTRNAGGCLDLEGTQLSPLSEVIAAFGCIFVGYSWVLLVPSVGSLNARFD